MDILRQTGHIHISEGWLRQTCRPQQEEDRWVQVNGAQEFHGPHPDYGQPTQEVGEQQGA